jgi:hypothetical protein
MKLIIWILSGTDYVCRSLFMDGYIHFYAERQHFTRTYDELLRTITSGYRLPYWNRPCWLPGLYNRVKTSYRLNLKI